MLYREPILSGLKSRQKLLASPPNKSIIEENRNKIACIINNCHLVHKEQEPGKFRVMPDLVCARTYNNREDAEIARGFLQSNGIAATVFTDDCGGTRPHLQLTEGVRLMVKQEDMKTALEMLEK